jgi:gamma-glutamyltranspeptidase/glutathione hydrolase
MRSIVVAPQCEAAWEAACVLREGGNAADAIVSAALVQGVVDPHRSGIGGFGCATAYFPRAGGAIAVDCHARAGSRCDERQWEASFQSAASDGFGYVIRGRANDVGYASIAVPGMLAVLSEIHARHGSMPWTELVLRAVRYAEDGFLVGPGLADYWLRPGASGRAATRERLLFTQAGRAAWTKAGGEPFAAGDVMRQPELARTYRRLAEEGAESFYRGSLARDIARDWERNGALVTADDLARYRPAVSEPVAGTYRGVRVLSTPLPGGGVALLQALKLLEPLELGALAHNGAAYVDAVARVLRAVSRDRQTRHADPAFGGPDASELLSARHLARLRDEAPSPPSAEAPCTTQIVVVDREGNAICLSHSLGFGSGVATEGLGFMYNNCMSGFDPRPGRSNSIAPGKARTTAVAETMVFDERGLRLVLGSPGGARITAAVLQVLLDVIDFDMCVAEAVVHPRFDAVGDERLELESRFPQDCVDQLSAAGWNARRVPRPFGYVGRVYAVEFDRGHASGVRVHAGVDPGEPGIAYRV